MHAGKKPLVSRRCKLFLGWSVPFCGTCVTERRAGWAQIQTREAEPPLCAQGWDFESGRSRENNSMFAMDITYLKKQIGPWCSFMGFNKISLGSRAGRDLQDFRWDLLKACLFACCGMDNVFLLFCHVGSKAVWGWHPFILLSENMNVFLGNPPPVVCVAGGCTSYRAWAWTPSSLWVRTGLPKWHRTEKYVLLHCVLLPLLCGFRATRMVLPIYAFIHSSEKQKTIYSGMAYLI